MSYTIEGATGPWEIVCGLEVHAQVTSAAKLFSGASAAYGGLPNAQVSPVDAGMPGMLPVLNGWCVEQAVRTGLGLNATINRVSVFERKNYFYPDLPSGYQISQYQHPIVGTGTLTIDLPDGATREIGITRLHLEMDAGKSLHDQRAEASLIDLNRSGVALMEIVSEPDIRSPEDAVLYLRKLRSILRYLGTCDGNMEEGSLRCDANVSVRKAGDLRLGTRCEIKNVNSVRFVARAIEYEARRQIEVIEGGGTIAQETRLFDSIKGETRSLRSKEEAHDYRYFPDPDLLPLILPEGFVERLAADMPELPDAKKARYIQTFALSAYDASVLVEDQERALYFEQTVNAGVDPKLAANLVNNNIGAHISKSGQTFMELRVRPEQIAANVALVTAGTISSQISKDVLVIQLETGEDPVDIVRIRGLEQVSDTGAIETAAARVIQDNPGQVATYARNPKVIGWFVGQVMKATGGKANPGMVQDILKRQLDA